MIVSAPSALRATSHLIVAVSPSLLAFTGDARAQTTAESSSYGASVQTNLMPLLGGGVSITLDPLPTASGTAPAPYDASDQVASLFVSSGLTGQILSTGIVEATASSDVPNSTGATASATIDALDLRIVGSLVTRLLTIGATTVQSTATIGGS